jgi:mRNA interferase YafQ
MRRIEPTTAFKRDYKRVSSGPHRAALEGRFTEIVNLLASDQPLPARCRDHPLTGEWKDHRDCHLWPDLVLIYRKPSPQRLQLVRLGSHSELGL